MSIYLSIYTVFPATESGLARTPAHHPTSASGDRQRISQGNVHASPESEGPGDTAFGGSEEAIILKRYNRTGHIVECRTPSAFNNNNVLPHYGNLV